MNRYERVMALAVKRVLSFPKIDKAPKHETYSKNEVPITMG